MALASIRRNEVIQMPVLTIFFYSKLKPYHFPYRLSPLPPLILSLLQQKSPPVRGGS